MRPTRSDLYTARAYAARHLVKKGDTRVPVDEAVMKFPRELKLPPTARQKDEHESMLLKAAMIQATSAGGGKGVRVRNLHKDGSLTDAVTGEVLRGPTPEFARE